MSSAPIVLEYGAFFELARQNRVIFYYVGYFSQNIIAAMAEAVKLQLEVSGVAGPTRRKLFSSFVEMAQNIIHYSADALTSPPPHHPHTPPPPLRPPAATRFPLPSSGGRTPPPPPGGAPCPPRPGAGARCATARSASAARAT